MEFGLPLDWMDWRRLWLRLRDTYLRNIKLAKPTKMLVGLLCTYNTSNGSCTVEGVFQMQLPS